MKRIYLDYASATPLDRAVGKSMDPFWSECFGNPSSIYSEGVFARGAISSARKHISELIGAHPDEILFTGSATESINLALRSSVNAWKMNNPTKTPHVIISKIEHSAVMECANLLEKEGTRVTRLSVDTNGIISLDELRESLTEETVFVSVMYVNNEIGVIEPVIEIAKLIRKWKKKFRGVARDRKPTREDRYPLFYTDACQAVNFFPLRIPMLGVDMMTLNSAKAYGPKGVGLLFVSRGVPMVPFIVGGGHERGLRAGTENVPGIIGFETALTISDSLRESEVKKMTILRDEFSAKLKREFPEIYLNSNLEHSAPHIINFSFQNVDHEFLALALDASGFSVSTKSACHENDSEVSHVLFAVSEQSSTPRPTTGIRVTLGRQTKRSDLESFVRALKKIMDTMIFSSTRPQ